MFRSVDNPVQPNATPAAAGVTVRYYSVASALRRNSFRNQSASQMGFLPRRESITMPVRAW
jgi:hypothetical protein